MRNLFLANGVSFRFAWNLPFFSVFPCVRVFATHPTKSFINPSKKCSGSALAAGTSALEPRKSARWNREKCAGSALEVRWTCDWVIPVAFLVIPVAFLSFYDVEGVFGACLGDSSTLLVFFQCFLCALGLFLSILA